MEFRLISEQMLYGFIELNGCLFFASAAAAAEENAAAAAEVPVAGAEAEVEMRRGWRALSWVALDVEAPC